MKDGENMINGMAAEVYARHVADMCARALCLRSLENNTWVPVTQMVKAQILYHYVDESRYTTEILFRKTYQNIPGSGLLDFTIPLLDSCNIRDSVYNAVYEKCKDMDCDGDHLPIDYEHSALMFITTIACSNLWDIPAAKTEYKQEMMHKFGMRVPLELIHVSPNVEFPDFYTKTSFMTSMNAKPLKKSILKKRKK